MTTTSYEVRYSITHSDEAGNIGVWHREEFETLGEAESFAATVREHTKPEIHEIVRVGEGQDSYAVSRVRVA